MASAQIPAVLWPASRCSPAGARTNRCRGRQRVIEVSSGDIPTLKPDPAHPYLEGRGLGPELVELFGLDFCSRGSMAGRICIPIHNEHGELVAYAGRWPGDDVPEGQEGYKVPAEFQKRRGAIDSPP